MRRSKGMKRNKMVKEGFVETREERRGIVLLLNK
jgi:hypothetical protein